MTISLRKVIITPPELLVMSPSFSSGELRASMSSLGTTSRRRLYELKSAPTIRALYPHRRRHLRLERLGVVDCPGLLLLFCGQRK